VGTSAFHSLLRHVRSSVAACVGMNTAFHGKEGRKIVDINDFAARVLVVEAEDAVPWTKPQDMPYEPGRPLPKLGGAFHTGFPFLLGFNNVYFNRRGLDEDALRREIEIDR
jgi:hypothetical protein